MNLVMALSVYGRVILGDPKRIEEGKRCLKQSEAIAKRLPFWYDQIENVYLLPFNIEQ
jgi:hypothetical protein